MQLEVTVRENHARFVARVTESQVVWGLRGPRGLFAVCRAHDGERNVLMFWSDRGYAARVRQLAYPEHEVADLTLFDFLFRWLPGMKGDGVLAGTNYTGDLTGLELEPMDLQGQLIEAMSDERLDEYDARFRAAIEAQGPD